MNVEVTSLPGIGVRKEFSLTKVARRIGVVDHRDGGTDLIFTKIDDPDTTVQVPLSDGEARTLASLLGAPRLVAQLQEEHRDLDGVSTRSLPVLPDSPYAGRRLGETEMRTRTLASIVAVLRAGQIHPSPGPEFGFLGGDMVVIVGTTTGLDAAASILSDG
ncbi:cation:proton antiporter regulatory subunit [Nocardia caishijiensis]|uniref:Potassium/proton antiporter regulatory subunit (CPA2 family) n=1 Tax=Nocardia caishijiensis TaxID=184756 RepID=A0ABQ6YNB2_9NOCA|nr:TrkA C-terminal domain-containing protein [Nocardia caishijiensis]KAF0847255.1 potassium/proton antiporter regulatory subunit (CPA2 family) [Nocardia caishijiensis]